MAMMCRGASRDKNEALAYKQLAHYCWPTDDASDIYDNDSHTALKAFVTQLAGNKACEWINIIMSDQLKQDYVQDIETNFKAQNKETSDWKKVNEEVRELTKMTSDVIPDKPSGSVLINAIYFQDLWVLPFQEELKPMKFKTSDGTTSNVKMMTLKDTLRVAKHEHMTAVHMLYETPGMGAWFVKNSHPEEGYKNDTSFNTLTSFVKQEFVQRTLTSSEEEFTVNVPQFKLEESIDLKQVFQALPSHKITEIFGTGNLDRMTTDTGEYFSIFKQDCMLKVDPKGTTAAGATISITTRGSRPPEVTFAHTFYMVIHYHDTILFVAKIGSPQDLAPSADEAPADKLEKIQGEHVSTHFANQEMELQVANIEDKEYPPLLPVQVTLADIKRSMHIVTKLHQDKDDKRGKVIWEDKFTDVYELSGTLVRTYTVKPDLLIRVLITFASPEGTTEEEKETTRIYFTPVYVKDTGVKEPEDEIYSKYDEPYEFAFPLQKEAGEEEDGLEYKDNTGKIFLKLRFRL
jgi:hypothetical protein